MHFLHFGKRKGARRRDFRFTSVAPIAIFHLKMGQRCDVEPTIDGFEVHVEIVVTGAGDVDSGKYLRAPSQLKKRLRATKLAPKSTSFPLSFSKSHLPVAHSYIYPARPPRIMPFEIPDMTGGRRRVAGGCVTTGINRGSVLPASPGIAKRAIDYDLKMGTRSSVEIATRWAQGTQRGQEWHAGTWYPHPRRPAAPNAVRVLRPPTSGPGSSGGRRDRPGQGLVRVLVHEIEQVSVLPASRSTHRQDLVSGMRSYHS